jgi:hypothetical protein
MNEKEAIEKSTADAFIDLYNDRMGSTFRVVEYSDAPDVRCKDESGNNFNLEITLTEDKPKDIQARLGRSDHRSSEALAKHQEAVKAGRANPLELVSCLQGNVTESLVTRVQAKLTKDYGGNAALVVRDTSPLDWDWNHVIDTIQRRLLGLTNPFDKGIWIISNSLDKLHKVV